MEVEVLLYILCGTVTGKLVPEKNGPGDQYSMERWS